jgi:hypothetical protein
VTGAAQKAESGARVACARDSAVMAMAAAAASAEDKVRNARARAEGEIDAARAVAAPRFW